MELGLADEQSYYAKLVHIVQMMVNGCCDMDGLVIGGLEGSSRLRRIATQAARLMALSADDSA